MDVSASATDAAVEPVPAQVSGSATRGTRWSLVAAAVSVVSLLGPIAASGIWDPYELKVADLSRRIALNLLGAKDLAVDGAVNAVPTLGELSRGQLPFTSVALGFRLFGLHEWAGRLPLALWGLVGIAALWALCSRLADRVTGAIAALALATMPLYFLHARTLLGDVVTFAGVALAIAGLGVAVFDRTEGAQRARRWPWLLVGLAGLGVGFASRGMLIGVCVPTLGVGFGWLALRGAAANRGDGVADAVGVVSLLGGLLALGVGVNALLAASANTKEFSMLVGAPLEMRRVLPTHDFVIHYLGHGLFPWSALLPIVVGRAVAAPYGVVGVARERETGLRALGIVVPAVALGVYGFMAPTTGHLPFAGVPALAILVAVSLRDFDRGAPGSRALSMGVAALSILFLYDFVEFPEKALSAFAVEGATFPDSFKATGTRLLELCTLAFVVVFFFTSMEREREGERLPHFVLDEYLAWPRALRSVWNGNLLFTLLVLETAMVALRVFLLLPPPTLEAWGRRVSLFKQLGLIPAIARTAIVWAWIAQPPAVLLLPGLAMALRDATRWLFARIPVRSAVVVASVAAFAGVLSLRFYPALAAQISPKEVFDAYKRAARPGEALGIFGVGSGSASYYAGRDVPNFNSANTAFNWLMERPERRWMAVRSKDLAQLNSLYRSKVVPAKNLPVIDARSSEILLISNQLLPGEKSANPFESWILTDPPNPTRRIDGNFGDQLDAIGWDVTSLDGAPVDAVQAGNRYHFRIYYKVIAPISGSWETFIHIDGFQRRFNGDHKTLEDRYAFNLWRVGDYIQDIYEFSLEPNFTPGEYHVFYGLFIGNKRLEVKRGRQNEDRLDVGMLRVR